MQRGKLSSGGHDRAQRSSAIPVAGGSKRGGEHAGELTPPSAPAAHPLARRRRLLQRRCEDAVRPLRARRRAFLPSGPSSVPPPSSASARADRRHFLTSALSAAPSPSSAPVRARRHELPLLHGPSMEVAFSALAVSSRHRERVTAVQRAWARRRIRPTLASPP
uniref:Uncharacterized protein n=1 Tax=Arundo donax TaxID=35708 RepID=A0A0A9AV99_ARUDO